MKQPILDLQALKTFMLGIELGNFAFAAKQLHKSTSAVSAQLKKLEQQTQSVLVYKEGRTLRPTAKGEHLLRYAQQMLALNEEAMAGLEQFNLQGDVHLGLQADFANEVMTQSLGQFVKAHPHVQLTTMIERNAALIQETHCGALDIAMTWESDASHAARTIGSLPIEWIAHPSFTLDHYLTHHLPLPLVLLDQHCLFQKKAVQALDAVGIKWQVVYRTQSLSGIWPAVQAGIGITARTHLGCPTSLTLVKDDLPPMGHVGIEIHQATSNANPLCDTLMRLLQDAIRHDTTTHGILLS